MERNFRDSKLLWIAFILAIALPIWINQRGPSSKNVCHRFYPDCTPVCGKGDGETGIKISFTIGCINSISTLDKACSDCLLYLDARCFYLALASRISLSAKTV